MSYTNPEVKYNKDNSKLFIAADKKPSIPNSVFNKWKEILNTIVITLEVSAALIIKVEKDTIKVLLINEAYENKYESYREFPIGSGTYSEIVINNKIPLCIPNILKEKLRKNNVYLDLGMTSYLGYPIMWQDGEVFGSICILNNNETHYNDNQLKIIELFRDSIEKDLNIINSDIIKDIECKRIIEEKQKIINETLEYEKIRSDFFANISHELRTPLNVLLSALQLIESQHHKLNYKDCSHDKYFGIMKQNCLRLLRLINHIIDITRIDSDYYEMNMQNLDIILLIKQITLSVSEYISNRGIKLKFSTKVKSKIISCDSEKFETVILNLLSNAVKFSNPGDLISVSIFEKDEFLFISIKDTGVGIPDDKLGVIFERFKQVNKPISRPHEGSGIGLSLVKSLIEKHSGKISVKSKVGEGSEFIIELPITKIKDKNITCNEVVKRCIDDGKHKISVEFSDIYN